MKKILLVLVFILPFITQSQNHYIIPDIGAPDMAVYVEMIAPHDQKGYFGDDGLYLSGVDTKVTVDVTKNDQYVTFGPMVVSWEGRMISTHIFIDKSANPTAVTTDPAFQVEFDISGTTVPAPRNFTYNIVKPQSLGVNGDISAINENVLGDGNLGFRSQMGAMILDSLTLKPGTIYAVSVKDPDGNIANGNQGFFPAIILSKGPINGNGSTISVSAQSKMAGPGGGGGGGRFEDFGLFDNSRGTDGGGGYTGGGKGGYNNSNVPGADPDSYKVFGTGTGGLGISFNGIPVDNPMFGYEASYGGTGHPYGTVGKQTRSGGTADEQGGYGGGSGYRNVTQGGAGGFATAGGGFNVTGGTTGGKVNGNKMSVPLAGGSGGAGGNPEGFSAESGEGGGGGGGLKLFGSEVTNIKLDANGHNGTDGDGSADGGPGSGGAISLMGKVGISNFDLSAEGGTRDGRNGGAGRVRYDGLSSFDDPSVTPATASKYRGVSTDTSNYIKPRHTLFGTKDPNKELDIYIKPKNGNWTLDRSVSASSINWLTNLNFDVNHEDEYYLVVVQKETKVIEDYTYVPEYVLSQAASNILLFDAPEIYCPKDTTFEVVNCENVIFSDTITIQSIGGDFLPINVQNNWIFGDKGFEVLNSGIYNVSPQSPDSLFSIEFRYTKVAGQTGTITDTLLVAYNLGSIVGEYKDTCRIAVSINLNDPNITFLDGTNTSEIDTLFLGDICVGDIGSAKFNMRNDSEFDLTDIRIEIEANGSNEAVDFTYLPRFLVYFPTSTYTDIEVFFEDDDKNAFKDGVSVTLYVFSAECPDPIDSLVISIKVLTSELTLSVANNTLDFANVQVGGTKDLIVSLTNAGDKPARVVTPPAVNAPFTLVSSSEALPFTLAPVSLDATAKIDFTYRFTPLAEGDYLDSTLYSSEENVVESSCEAEIKLYLKATAQAGEVSYRDTLDFGILYECVTDSSNIFVKNESSSLIRIDAANAVILGADANYFKFAAKPSTISVGGQNNFLIGFIPPTNPTTAGMKVGRLEFDLDPAGTEKEIVYIKAEVDTFLVDYTPGKPFDMGQIPVGYDSAPQILTLTNNGKLPRTVTGFANPIGSKITITHALGFPVTIPAGGSENFDVDISLLAADVGAYSETDTAIFEMCENKLPIDILAEGVEGKLEIETDLNLGVYPPCFDISKLVIFRNAGNAEIILDSVIVEENGVEIDRINNVPQTIMVRDNGNPFGGYITITKSGLQVGTTYKAILKAYVSQNGATQLYTKEITVDIKSGIIITPNPVDFGSVPPNTLNSRSVTISIDPTAPFANTEDISILVDRASLVPAYTEYQFISPNAFVLNSSKTSEVVDIDFTPTLAQNYDATLELDISIPNCNYKVPVDLLANSGEGDTLLVYVKDYLEVEPNQNDFRIPIYGKLMTQSSTETKTTSIQLSKLDINFNKTIFFPMSLSNGEYLSRTTDAALSRISIKMDSPVQVTSGQEVILTEMIGTTMLGNQKDNLIQISSYELTDETGITEKQYHGGLFNLTICQQGGDRLLEYTNGFNYSLFNSTDNLEIQANLIETGYHKVSIITTTGQSEIISELIRQRDDSNGYIINFDTSHLSSGVYYIVFETPDRYKTEKLIIIR